MSKQLARPNPPHAQESDNQAPERFPQAKCLSMARRKQAIPRARGIGVPDSSAAVQFVRAGEPDPRTFCKSQRHKRLRWLFGQR